VSLSLWVHLCGLQMGVIIGVPPQADILAIVPLCAVAGKCCHHSPLGSRGGVIIESIVGWQQL